MKLKFLSVILLCSGMFIGCKTPQKRGSTFLSQSDVGEMRGYGDYNRAIKEIFYGDASDSADFFDFTRFAKNSIVMRDLIGFSIREDDRPNYSASPAGLAALNYAFHTLIDHVVDVCNPKSDQLNRCEFGSYGRELIAQLFSDTPDISPIYSATIAPFSVDITEFDAWIEKYTTKIESAKTLEQKKLAIRVMFLSTWMHPKFLLRTI